MQDLLSHLFLGCQQSKLFRLSSHKHCDILVCELYSFTITLDEVSLKIYNVHIHLYFIATHYLKLCPCGRYTQLNVILYCNNHILKL